MTIEEMFLDTSIHKDVLIKFDSGETWTNETIYSESLQITESICSASELIFGTCEANKVKFKVSNMLNSHINEWFNLSFVLGGETYNVGRYKVVEDKAEGDHSKRNITAYDKMYDVINTNVASWYNALKFPITLQNFRTSFCNYFGLQQESSVLCNDSLLIEKTIDADELSGADVISCLCELNACFPNISRNNKMEYITLPKQEDYKALYPRNDLYPKEDLFPIDDGANGIKRITKSLYRTCTYEEYTTSKITKIQIRKEENDIGVIYGTDGNCYIIEDNFLVYGATEETLRSVASNLLNIMTNVVMYRPFTCNAVGNPFVKVGDGVRLSTKYELIESIVFKRVLKGIQSLSDAYSSKGVKNYEKDANGVHTSIKQLKNATNKLTRTISETKSELNKKITDTENEITTNYTSAITQTAQSIRSDVSKNITDTKNDITTSYQSAISQSAQEIRTEVKSVDEKLTTESSRITQNTNAISTKVSSSDYTGQKVVSMINQTAESVKISASKIDLSGYVTVNSLGSGGTTSIDGSRIKTGTIQGVEFHSIASTSSVKIAYGRIYGYNHGEEIGIISFLNTINDIKCVGIQAKYSFVINSPKFWVGTGYDWTTFYEGHSEDTLGIWAWGEGDSFLRVRMLFKNGLYTGYEHF